MKRNRKKVSFNRRAKGMLLGGLMLMTVFGGFISRAEDAAGYDPARAKENQGWTSAVTGVNYHSYGKWVYGKGEEQVVMDAGDIATLDDLVGKGKRAMMEAIGNVDADGRLDTGAWTQESYPGFPHLAEKISLSQTVPENKKAEQAVNTEGAACFYRSQTAAEERDLGQTTTSDTGFPVHYLSATADNLSAGAVAFVDGRMLIGNGTDNESCYQRGYVDGYEKAVDGVSLDYTYHVHRDGEGTEQGADFQASEAGGCFTGENIIYTTVQGECGGSFSSKYDRLVYDDSKGEMVSWTFYRCGSCGQECPWDHYNGQRCWRKVNKQVDSGGRYYTCNCGKTESSIESVTIRFE
jgi:hypothetical protein